MLLIPRAVALVQLSPLSWSVTAMADNKCRSCGTEIEWARTVRGVPIPLDIEPDDDGNLVLVNGVARATIPEDRGRPLRISHFATCPQSGSWRRDRK